MCDECRQLNRDIAELERRVTRAEGMLLKLGTVMRDQHRPVGRPSSLEERRNARDS